MMLRNISQKNYKTKKKKLYQVNTPLHIKISL